MYAVSLPSKYTGWQPEPLFSDDVTGIALMKIQRCDRC